MISVYDKKSIDDAIVQANSLPFAFQASVFSNDYTEIMDAVNRLDGSAIMVNEHSAFRVDWMPFAGRKRSGLGVGGISYTLRGNVAIEDDGLFVTVAQKRSAMRTRNLISSP